MDIHSAAGDILYNWGDDDNQSVDPSMSFLDPRWDGKRGVVTIDDYREWISERDGAAARGVARRVAGAMRAVGGRSFNPLQAVGLYPTSGASDDYAFSRFQADPKPTRPTATPWSSAIRPTSIRPSRSFTRTWSTSAPD